MQSCLQMMQSCLRWSKVVHRLYKLQMQAAMTDTVAMANLPYSKTKRRMRIWHMERLCFDQHRRGRQLVCVHSYTLSPTSTHSNTYIYTDTTPTIKRMPHPLISPPTIHHPTSLGIPAGRDAKIISCINSDVRRTFTANR